VADLPPDRAWLFLLRNLLVDAFIEAPLQNVYTHRGFVGTRSMQAIPVTFGILF